MSGALRVVGIGPGPACWITPEASAAIATASDVVGYRSYVERVAVTAGQRLHATDNGDELERARFALELAQQGANVVVVSGGDPGVFAMAAAVFEAIEAGPPAWRALDVAVLPGVTAALAAAARLGAPLGSDFCVLSLSDNLKPWELIERRLVLAAQADFVIALYNAASRARPLQVQRAFEILRQQRAASTVTMFARAIGRSDEHVQVITLGDADPSAIDMRTLVLIGSSATRCIARAAAQTPWVYSPRRVLECP
jgi:precorrin-3B C17-methyltransferase